MLERATGVRLRGELGEADLRAARWHYERDSPSAGLLLHGTRGSRLVLRSSEAREEGEESGGAYEEHHWFPRNNKASYNAVAPNDIDTQASTDSRKASQIFKNRYRIES